MNRLKKFVFDESGQGLVEYSLILFLLTIVTIGAVILFSNSVNDLYEEIKKDVLDAL